MLYKIIKVSEDTLLLLSGGGLYNVSMWWVIEDDCRTSIDEMIKSFFTICGFKEA